MIKAQLPSFLLLICSTLIFGCGHADRAMDASTEMPPKMDNMLKVSADLNTKMDSTNSKMDATNDRMDRLLKQMEQMNKMVKVQAEDLPFEGLLKPDNGKGTPIPFDLLPFAQKFAQNTPPEDFVQIVELWLLKLNSNPPPQVDMTTEDGKAKMGTYVQKQTPILVALESICGFLSDDQTQKIIEDQIEKAGPFRDTAYQLLALRFSFLHEVKLQSLLLAAPMTSAGRLEAAVYYTASMEKIVNLPFVSKISLVLKGIPPDPKTLQPKVLQADPSVVAKTWSDIMDKVDLGLKDKTIEKLSDDPAANQAFFESEKTRIARAMVFVNDKIAQWKQKSPQSSTPAAP